MIGNAVKHTKNIKYTAEKKGRKKEYMVVMKLSKHQLKRKEWEAKNKTKKQINNKSYLLIEVWTH